MQGLSLIGKFILWLLLFLMLTLVGLRFYDTTEYAPVGDDCDHALCANMYAPVNENVPDRAYAAIAYGNLIDWIIYVADSIFWSRSAWRSWVFNPLTLLISLLAIYWMIYIALFDGWLIPRFPE